MFFLRIFCLLALGFSLTAIAFEGEDTTQNSNSGWGEPDKRIQERPTPRRRGIGCKAPHILAIQVSCENRSFCYTRSEEVSLWQPANSSIQSRLLIIKNMNTKETVNLRWQAGQTHSYWPTETMPIEPDTEYSIKIIQGKNDRPSYHFKMLHQIPADYKTPANIAKWMEEKGCTEQAEMLNKVNVLLSP